MCEEVSLLTWGELDNDTDIEWLAKFHDGRSKVEIQDTTRPLPTVGTIYYLTLHTSE